MSRCFVVKLNFYTSECMRILPAVVCRTKSCNMSTYKSCGENSVKKDSENECNKDVSEVVIPEAPTNCCMSGCANCVWIQYAEELASLFKDGGQTSRQIILQKVDDPNMKAFLLTELRALENKLEDTKT